MMTLSRLFRYVCIVVGAVALSTAPAAGAEPDPERALRSLLSIPLDAAGDALGAAGLVGAAVIAIDADVVALVDDNGLTQSFLRGFASTPLRHTAGALSEFATAAVSGLHTPDASSSPESNPTDPRLPRRGESPSNRWPGVWRHRSDCCRLTCERRAARDACDRSRQARPAAGAGADRASQGLGPANGRRWLGTAQCEESRENSRPAGRSLLRPSQWRQLGRVLLHSLSRLAQGVHQRPVAVAHAGSATSPPIRAFACASVRSSTSARPSV